MNADTLIQRVLRTRFFKEAEGPLEAAHTPGESPLIVVVGENASGKSLFRRLVGAVCRTDTVEHIHLSMEGRASSGIVRGMVYGTEEYDATGFNTAGMILGAFRTSRGRKNPHVVTWDEPEMGLSDNAQAGAGVEIAEFLDDPPEMLQAAVVITHSRHLVRELVRHRPHLVVLGTHTPWTVEGWLTAPVVPRRMDAVREAGRAMYRKVSPLVKE